jgi:peroxiredoxin
MIFAAPSNLVSFEGVEFQTIAASGKRRNASQILAKTTMTSASRVAGFCAVVLSCLAIGSPLLAGEDAPEKSKVGESVADFTLGDFRGKEVTFSAEAKGKTAIVAFLGTECPLAKLYAAKLVELAKKNADKNVVLFGVMSNQQDSQAEIAHFAKTHEIEFPLLRDAGNVVADQFAAQRTPEVFLVDSHGKIRYAGRIDDQHTYGIVGPKVKQNYLVDALESLIAGKEIATTFAEPVGCHIGRVLKPTGDATVTYSKHIAPIFQNRCVQCHREGEIAPFAMTNYQESVGWAEMIAEVVSENRMPPWSADPKYGHFANNTSLSKEEKEQILHWVSAGAPEGDPKDLPAPREFPTDWRIGKPDLVIQMADKPFDVPAEGEVKYQHFVVDPRFTEDKWIQAAECRAGNRTVVHHIIVATRPPSGKATATNDSLDSEWLTASAPGSRPLVLPTGLAKFVPAGSRIIFQLHYTPNGKAAQDMSSVALKFADPATVKKEVATVQAINQRFKIPPKASNHRVEAQYRFEKDCNLLALFPHMHLRGKSFRYTAVYPDGKEEILLDVPRYDFNWQNGYEYAEAKKMPAGTRMVCVAHYDNSEENLANPNPNDTVRWGDQTWEEMMIGYFDVTLTDQDLSKKVAKVNRKDAFLKAYAEAKPVVDDGLKQAAKAAPASADEFRVFATAAKKLLPQVDRICLSAVEGDALEVVRANPDPGPTRAGAGFKVENAKVGGVMLHLAELAQKDKTVIYPQTMEVKAPDFRMLSRRFASSVHVPVVVDGKKGTLNFWSSDADAFPVEAISLMEEMAKPMTSEGAKPASDKPASSAETGAK